MRCPSFRSLHDGVVGFVEREQITWRLLIEPARSLEILLRYRFVHFFVVGVGGQVIGLGVTWALASRVLGIERYFTAYLMGTACALVWNFTLYTLAIFKTSRQHLRRLFVYFVYISTIILIQAWLVKTITPLVGVQWYLAVIASIIGVFSLLNFLVFKLSIFRENSN